MDLPAIIRSAAEASIVASMQGVTAVTTAEVEAHLAADDRGRGFSPIVRVYLCHIYSVTGDKEVPYIWRDMALAHTKVKVLALLSQLFLTWMSA